MANQKIWGVVDKEDCIHDVSCTEIGAKRYATNRGYTKVGYRLAYNYHGTITHVKNERTGNWVIIKD